MGDSKRSFSDSSSDDEQLAKNVELLNIIKDKKNTPKVKKTKIDTALANGANVNFQDLNYKKRTPLYYAVKNSEEEIVKYLLLKGANVITEHKDANPLECAELLKQKALSGSAEEQNYLDIIEILKHKISRNSPQPSTSQSQTYKTTASMSTDGDSEKSKQKQKQKPKDVLNKKLNNDLLEKSKTYKVSKGPKDALHGDIYQLNLLMLYAKKCQKARYQFWLATEMDEAGKFDDLVLEFINSDDDTKHGIFLQAKHIRKENEDKIKATDLLTTSEGKFSLQEYFRSYQSIKKNNKFKEQTEKYFIINTNIDFEFDKESKPLNTSLKKLNSLYFEPHNAKIGNFNMKINDKIKESKFYKLVGSHHVDERKKVVDGLTTLFKETTDFHKLAEELAEHLMDKKQINLNTPLFKEYQDFLVKEVIDIQNNKLRKKFIDLDSTLSSEAKDFQKVLLTIFKETRNAKLKKEQPKNDVNTSQKKKKLAEIEFTTSINYKKVLLMEKNPMLKDPKNLADEIVRLIEKKSNNKITIYKINEKLIPEIYKLAGHVLVQSANDDKTTTFRDTFFNNKSKLEGNLEDFRTNLKNALKTKNKIKFDELKNYTFQITDFLTCKESDFIDLLATEPAFPPQEVTRCEIEGFIDSLIFAVNQPNENELSKIINKEIGEEFNLKSSESVTHGFQIHILRARLIFFRTVGR